MLSILVGEGKFNMPLKNEGFLLVELVVMLLFLITVTTAGLQWYTAIINARSNAFKKLEVLAKLQSLCEQLAIDTELLRKKRLQDPSGIIFTWYDEPINSAKVPIGYQKTELKKYKLVHMQAQWPDDRGKECNITCVKGLYA